MAEQAQEMVTDATPEKKAFMAKRSTHEDRIKKDEEELQQLLKEQTGDEEQEENKDSIEEKEEPKNAEERTFKKRYGDLRRHSQEKEKEYQKRLKDLESQLDNATKKEMKLPKSDEDLEAWAKEYPDVAKIVETIAMKKAREQSEQLEKKIKQIDEMNISEILTINGVRFTLEDGSWGLIRASSNKPSLVIVTESTKSNERKKKIFEFIDNLLQKTGKIGDYDQKI